MCKVKWWEIHKISCFVHFFKLATLHSNSAGHFFFVQLSAQFFYLNKIRTNDLILRKVENVRLENKNKSGGNPVSEVDRKADIYRTLWPRLIQFAWLHLQSPSSFPLSATLFACSLVSFNSVVLCMLWNYVIILECFVFVLLRSGNCVEAKTLRTNPRRESRREDVMFKSIWCGTQSHESWKSSLGHFKNEFKTKGAISQIQLSKLNIFILSY